MSRHHLSLDVFLRDCPHEEPVIVMDDEDAIAEDRRRERLESFMRAMEIIYTSKRHRLTMDCIFYAFKVPRHPNETKDSIAKRNGVSESSVKRVLALIRQRLS